MTNKTTPLLSQYLGLKERNPGVLLLMRVGDFYEAFGEDAKILAATLNIILTRKACGNKDYIELAGFPHHAMDTYLSKLMHAGLKVALCEQLEEAGGKTLIKRDIKEILTPAVNFTTALSPSEENTFLASLKHSNGLFGLALLDISTGEFLIQEAQKDEIESILLGHNPKEVLVPQEYLDAFEKTFPHSFCITPLHDWVFETNYAQDLLIEHFGKSVYNSFSLPKASLAVAAAGSALHYLHSLNYKNLTHINNLQLIHSATNHICLDKFTIRNLELVEPLLSTAGSLSLLSVIDHTCTPMGRRLLRNWLLAPLKNLSQLSLRLQMVNFFYDRQEVALSLRKVLESVGDFERLIAKLAVRKIKPKELLKVSQVLDLAAEIKALLNKLDFPNKNALVSRIHACKRLSENIFRHLVDVALEAPSANYLIAPGVSKELDELRDLKNNAQSVLSRLLEEQIQKTGINSLKIGFSASAGYYLEVTHKHVAKVPPEWIRRQTLVNAQRYTLPELIAYTDKVVTLDSKIQQLEEFLYAQLLEASQDYISKLQGTVQVFAKLDVLVSFGYLARKNRYVQPRLLPDLDSRILIKGGRHPVIERCIGRDRKYVTNDTCLDANDSQIMLLTGPNMGGKSSYLRQTALIVLLAQIGCYVPAEEAEISVVDKIFVRAGASDNLSLGESTFMVEMLEVATILRNMTPNSLIIFDEVGRGTSAQDGLALAQAILEYIASETTAKVLFATHYHELHNLCCEYSNIKSYKVVAKETAREIIFLHQICEGVSNKSFGLNVAKLAGLPSQILARAGQLITVYASPLNSNPSSLTPFPLPRALVDRDLEIIEKIRAQNIENMTPLQAMTFLHQLKQECKRTIDT